jgi:hypothetical protein
MSNWTLEIEDASQDWQSIDEGIASFSCGTSSVGQVIPSFSLTFSADTVGLGDLLDPSINPTRARLRYTDGTVQKYFRLVTPSGSAKNGLDYPTLAGTAYAGIIKGFKDLTYDFSDDILASDMARFFCTQYPESSSGIVVGVLWLATHDPSIPGGRYLVSKQPRLGLLKNLVEMCGAILRVSTDGKTFEVVDHPTRVWSTGGTLSADVTRTFDEAQSLSYKSTLVEDGDGNGIIVQGESPDYTRATLPTVSVSVSPTGIDADDTSTATATATVYDSNGDLVTHDSIVEEAITAGSYTEIPVTGCADVQAVWLNTGTTDDPEKGTRLDDDDISYTSDTITVPDNSTQLFIVSYTQAEVVSWSLSTLDDEITGEAQSSTGEYEVATDYAIGAVSGVYRSSDTTRSGINYYTGGSFSENTQTITLGISPGDAGQSLLVDYYAYNAATDVLISPSSSLCDSSGQATTTVVAGTTSGTAKVVATALSEEGYAYLSLFGSDVDSMTLASDKSEITRGSTTSSDSRVTETDLVVHSGDDPDSSSKKGYVIISNSCDGDVSIEVTDVAVSYLYTELVDGDYRMWMQITTSGASWSYGTSTCDVTYDTTEDVESAYGEATITASVVDEDGLDVTDGTTVTFSLPSSPSGCSLSTTTAYTVDGDATTTLTAGSKTGTAKVTAVCDSQTASLYISIVDSVTNDSGISTTSLSTGSSLSSSDDDDEDSDTADDSWSGSYLCGDRQLVDCDGVGYSNVWITIGQITKQTDESGWFTYCADEAGSVSGTAMIDGEEESFSFTLVDPDA